MSKSFSKLKESLTTPPVLALPYRDCEFILDTAASNYGIGSVLSQKQNGIERVIDGILCREWVSTNLDYKVRQLFVPKNKVKENFRSS